MDLSVLGLIVSGLTLIATIIGWFFTHKKQVELVELSREHSIADRELARFTKDTKKFIRRITETLSKLALDCFVLESLLKEDVIYPENYIKAIKQVADSAAQCSNLKTDPDYEVFKQYLSNPQQLDSMFNNLITNISTLLKPNLTVPLREEKENLRLLIHESAKESVVFSGSLSKVYGMVEAELAIK